MLLTVIAISGTLLGATTIAGLLLVYQIRQATDLASSAKAIYAADAGIEWSMYKYFVNTSTAPVTFSNKASVSVACYDLTGAAVDCTSDAVSVIKSRGSAGAVSRAFELEL